MIISITYFDYRKKDKTLDEIIEGNFCDKESHLFIPELNKKYTYEPESLAVLKRDITKFYDDLPITEVETETVKRKETKKTKTVDTVETAVKGANKFGSVIATLMWIGGLILVLLGIYYFIEDAPVLGGACIGSAISSIILASLLNSLTNAISELYNMGKKLEKELKEARKEPSH